MLEHLHIRNFQPHERIDVPLGQPITTIVGPTESGKTAVLRALQWLCLNENYPGTIRFGAENALARLHVDGRIVRRKKGKVGNTYKLDEEVFKSFNTSVPGPIANLLNIGELNFQNQIDSPFWFSETAGQLVKQLNKIVNLEIIDKVMGEVDTEHRRIRFRVEESEQRLQEARQQRDTMDWIKEADSQLKALEDLSETIEAKRSDVEALRCQIGRVSEHVKTRLNANGKATEARFLADLSKTIVESHQRAEDLRNTIGSINRKSKLLEDTKRELHEVRRKLTLSGKKCPLCHQPVK